MVRTWTRGRARGHTRRRESAGVARVAEEAEKGRRVLGSLAEERG